MALSRHPIPSDLVIGEFWRWFSSVSSELGRNLDNPRLLQDLDSRVSELGSLAWEVGPGLREENALVITPDGAKEFLGTTRHIVELAPLITGWEFHAARPPRKWDLRFSVESDSGDLLPVDARSWRYVLLEFPNGTFDIVVEQIGFDPAGVNDRYRAAVILLDGIIGEVRRLETITNIEAVATLSRQDTENSSSVAVLREHLDALQRVS